VIDPVAQIGFQIGAVAEGVLTPPRKRGHLAIKVSCTRSGKSSRASFVAFSRGVANVSIRALPLNGAELRSIAAACHAPFQRSDDTLLPGRKAVRTMTQRKPPGTSWNRGSKRRSVSPRNRAPSTTCRAPASPPEHGSGIRPALVGEAARGARAALALPAAAPRSSCSARWRGSSPRSRSCPTKRRSVAGSPRSTSRSPDQRDRHGGPADAPRQAGCRPGRRALAANPLRHAWVALRARLLWSADLQVRSWLGARHSSGAHGLCVSTKMRHGVARSQQRQRGPRSDDT